MKTTFTILASILLCFNLCAAKSIAPPEAKKTQVVIIGTLHKGHYKNPKYSPEILKEIILSLKPDAILIESPLSQVDPNGRPLEKFRTKDPNWDPERWITDEVAMQLGIKQIPFDRPDREQFYEKTDFLQRRKDYLASMKKWFEELKKGTPESADLKTVQLLDNAFTTTTQLRNGPPEIINSEGFDALTRLRRSLAFDIIPEILKKYPAYKSLFDEGRFIKDVWQERNRIMAKNIVKAAKEYPGKRLVVTTGAMHRYILRDLLKDEKSIDLKEYWQVTSPEVEKPQKSDESNQPTYLKLISPDKLKEDLDFLFKTIEEVHPNMYAYTPKEEFDPLRDELYRQVNRSMNRLEFYKLVAPVVAKLKNGHTFLQLPFEFFQDYALKEGKYFPLEMHVDEVTVILTQYSGPYNLPLGAEVLAIDSQNAVEFLRKAAGYFPSEGRTYNLAMLQRESMLAMYLWLEKADKEFLTLQIKADDGQVKKYDIKALDYNELKNFEKKQAKNNESKTQSISKPENQWYSYRYVSDCNTGLIEFNLFHDPEKFETFLKETFSQLRRQNVPNLIIDIRNNPGGSSSIGDELIKYLTDRPFRQFEEVRVRMSRQLLKAQPDLKISHPDAKIGSIATVQEVFRKAENNPFLFKGRVFVLIGPKSASSSVCFASAVKHFHIGTLIGQETIDTTVNYGDCISNTVPNSGLSFSVACKYFIKAGGKPDGRGVLPDYEVKQTPEDTAKGVDTVLEFTLNLIKNSKAEK